MAVFSTGGAFRMRGRRPMGLRGMEGKPFHPPLTDIPIAAYTIAPVMDVIAFIGRGETWSRELHLAAGWVLLAGAIVAVPTALTGLADWLSMGKGSGVRKIANAHALTMVLATALVLTSLAIRFLTDLRDGPSGIVTALSVAIAVVTFLGGMIGGSLVYDHSFNVRTWNAPGEERERMRRAG